jgi:hypothetical protein
MKKIALVISIIFLSLEAVKKSPALGTAYFPPKGIILQVMSTEEFIKPENDCYKRIKEHFSKTTKIPKTKRLKKIDPSYAHAKTYMHTACTFAINQNAQVEAEQRINDLKCIDPLFATPINTTICNLGFTPPKEQSPLDVALGRQPNKEKIFLLGSETSRRAFMVRKQIKLRKTLVKIGNWNNLIKNSLNTQAKFNKLLEVIEAALLLEDASNQEKETLKSLITLSDNKN